ncbi:MAG: Initiation factor 2 subunit family, partial [Pseudomonadota bacterium]
IAPAGASVFNPSFDVTPAHLISAIVTDRGVIDPVVGEQLLKVLDEAVVCS